MKVAIRNCELQRIWGLKKREFLSIRDFAQRVRKQAGRAAALIRRYRHSGEKLSGVGGVAHPVGR